MKVNQVFINNKIIPEEEAFISITDRGFLFGEGVFTTIRVSEGQCEYLNDHLQRLRSHAKILNFEMPEISYESIQELIFRNYAGAGIWKLKIIITIPEIDGKKRAGNLLMTIKPYEECLSPAKLCLFPYPFQNPLSELKTLSYANHLFIREYSKIKGFSDGISVTESGLLLETSCSNLFWMDERGCWIPDFELPYLKGIILKQIIKNLMIPIHYIKATFQDISDNANVFISNSLMHVKPVEMIESRSFKRNEKHEKLLNELIKRGAHL